MVQDFNHLEKVSFSSEFRGNLEKFSQEGINEIKEYDSLFEELKSLGTEYKNLNENGLITIGVYSYEEIPQLSSPSPPHNIEKDNLKYLLNPIKLGSIQSPEWPEGETSEEGIYLMYPDELNIFRAKDYREEIIRRGEGFFNSVKDMLNPKYGKEWNLADYRISFNIKNVSEQENNQLGSGFRAIHPNTIVYPMYREQYQKLEEIMTPE